MAVLAATVMQAGFPLRENIAIFVYSDDTVQVLSSINNAGTLRTLSRAVARYKGLVKQERLAQEEPPTLTP